MKPANPSVLTINGGPKHSAAQRITAEMAEALRGLSPFDPEHLSEDIPLGDTRPMEQRALERWESEGGEIPVLARGHEISSCRRIIAPVE